MSSKECCTNKLRPHLSDSRLRWMLYIYFVLEAVWLVLWFFTITWIIFQLDSVVGNNYRSDVTNAFVHFSGVMFMITASANEIPDIMVLVILGSIILYDIMMVCTVQHLASSVLSPAAKSLQQAVVIYGLILSVCAFVWYACYWAYYNSKFNKVNSKVQNYRLMK